MGGQVRSISTPVTPTFLHKGSFYRRNERFATGKSLNRRVKKQDLLFFNKNSRIFDTHTFRQSPIGRLWYRIPI
jgi:hypothetical protein